jgi:allophanate hydrolase
MKNFPRFLSIEALKKSYQSGEFTPRELIGEVQRRIQLVPEYNIWIHALDLEQMLEYLNKANPQGELYGVPFAIKDNIDLAGVPTTAGCPDYARTPTTSAFVVEQLLKAGAIPVGKTNMDQFATGLVGTRSPYGICKHSYHQECISGGSSSGSGVAVALGLCSFSLGTDTAGSGRVPAVLNGIYGYKPTPGLVSMTGVVPACRSLDTVSIFYTAPRDMEALFPVVTAKDDSDAFQNTSTRSAREGRFCMATIDPDSVSWKGSGEGRGRFCEIISSYQRRGYHIESVDLKLFFEVARMLYEGPWVAERYAAVGEFIKQHPDMADPTVAKIIMGGANISGEQVFKYQYQLMEKKRQVEKFFERYQGLLLPTIGGWFSRAEVAADPIGVNSYLGTFTNFANLLHLSACALPVRFSAFQGEPGFGLTLFQRGGEDESMLQHAHGLSQEATFCTVVVCGAHLSGEPLNPQLTERGAILRQSTCTSAKYRFYALSNGKPGLIRCTEQESQAGLGAEIEVEVWEIPTREFGTFVQAIPAPLGIGKVECQDGQWHSGFVVENSGLVGASEITHLGGWRTYKKSRGL